MKPLGYLIYDWRVYYQGNNYADFAGFWQAMQMHYEPARDEDLVRKIKAADPNIRILLYRNIRACYTREPEELEYFRSQGWILKNAQGEEIMSSAFGYRIVDIGNPAYQEWLANWLLSWIQNGGFDGAYLDNSMFGQREVVYDCVGVTSGCNAQTTCPPINPRTGQAYTQQDWLDAFISCLRTVRNKLGNMPIVGNGVWNGNHFFRASTHPAYTAIMLDGQLDGFMLEGWLTAGDGNFYSEEDWKKSVDTVVWIEQNCPLSMFPVLSSCWLPPPTGVSQEEFVMFCFASASLGWNGQRKLYLINQPEDATLEFHRNMKVQQLMQIDLGTPIEAYSWIDGSEGGRVYVRRWSQGIALVNPTDTPVTITLAQKYFKPVTGEEIETIEVAGHRGEVLVSPPTPIPLGIFPLFPALRSRLEEFPRVAQALSRIDEVRVKRKEEGILSQRG